MKYYFLIGICLLAVCVQAQWIQSSEGIFGGKINSVMYDGATAYACTDFDGVYKSTDNGNNWSFSSSGIPQGNVISVIRHNGYLFAGTDGSGVYRSSDNGANWQSVQGPFLNLKINCFEQEDSILFVGTNGSGIYVSTNSGISWTSRNSGLTCLFVNSIIRSGIYIFAGTSVGVYSSINSGMSWLMSNSGIPNNTFVSSLAKSGNYIFAGTTYSSGFYVSTNNGSTWTQKNSGLPQYSIIYHILVSDIMIYVSTGNGLFYSTNYGEQWSDLNNGIYSRTLYSLAKNGNSLMTASDMGVFRSTNLGEVWAAATHGFPPNIPVYDFAVQGNEIYAGTYGSGIFKSTDNGITWQAKNNGLRNFEIESFQVKNDAIFASTHEGIFKSTNGGDLWEIVFPIKLVYSMTQINGVLFGGICSCSGGGIVRSTDDGYTWEPVVNGLINYNITALISLNNTVYAGSGNGVFRTTNYGDEWISMMSGLPENTSVACFATKGDTLIIGTNESGAYYMKQQDSVFRPFGTGIPQGVKINRIVSYNSHLFASTAIGFYYLPNTVSQWQSVNDGMTKPDVYGILLYGNEIFVGSGVTAHNGVFRRIINQFVPVIENTAVIPDNIYLYESYPNPFNSTTVIKYSVPEKTFVDLKIYDVLGREMLTLEQSLKPAGTYSVRFDASRFSSGIYFCLLKSAKTVKYQRLVLIK